MDAQYLKETISPFLTEALTATVIASPDDPVAFLGQYLLQIVDRHRKDEQRDKDLKQAEDDLKVLGEKAAIELQEIQATFLEKETYQQQLTNFLTETLASKTSKDEALIDACNFVASYLKVPAAYVAHRISSPDGEDNDTLNYVAANESQAKTVIGRVIPKTGVTFRVFDRPELPEGESTEESTDEVDENGDPIVRTKPLPPLEPLVVENVMRNDEITFFGIPQLGSLAVIPVEYQSTSHVQGCEVVVEIPPPVEETVNTEEETKGESDNAEETPSNENNNKENGEEEGVEGEGKDGGEAKEELVEKIVAAPPEPITKFIPKTVKREFIFAADTMGTSKLFQSTDMSVLKAVANGLAATFERLDREEFDLHADYIRQCIAGCTETTEWIEATKALEVETVSALEASLNPPPPAEGEEAEGATAAPVEEVAAEPPHELFKPFKLAEKASSVWSDFLQREEVKGKWTSIGLYRLPAPPVVLSLFKAIADLLGLPADTYNDNFGTLSWSNIVKNLVPTLPESLAKYSGVSSEPIASRSSLEGIKSFCESNGVLDQTQYETVVPKEVFSVLQPLLLWLQKAIDFREAAVNYHREALAVSLENILP